MEPDEFLSRDAFDALSYGEQHAYMERVRLALKAVRRGNDGERQLLYAKHCLDLAEWTLPPDEFEENMWRHKKEYAAEIVETLERIANDPELTEADRRSLEESLETARLIVEVTRDIQGLDEIDPRGEG